MTARPGWPASSGLATFQDIRRGLAGTIVRDTAGVLRKGVFRTSDASLITGKATMAVDVADFVAVLDRSGAVIVPNVGVTTVTISTAPASGFRWSVIYVKQRESEAPFSDGADGPVIDKVESVTSLVAARALLPAGALELGHVQVAPGTTGTNAAAITQTFPYTAQAGGVLTFRTAGERDLANTFADGQLGQVVGDPSLYHSTAGAWKQVNSGLNLIKPSSVTGGVISGEGLVTFTSVNLVALDGIFSTGYDNYLIEIDVTGVSAITNLFARLRAAGAADSASNYYAQQLFAQGGAASAVAASPLSSWLITTTPAHYHGVKLEVRKPGLAAVRSSMTAEAASTDVTGAPVMGSSRGAYWHGTPAAYDGFQIAANGAITMSGTIRVYGYYNG